VIAPWYFAELPQAAREQVQGGAAAMMLFFMFGLAASVLIGAYGYFGLIRAKRYVSLETSLLLLAIAFIATGSMEFVREGVRKPYLIYGVYYSNGIPRYGDWPQRLANDGVLAFTPFVRAPGQSVEDVHRLPLHEAGRLVFQAECRMCHEVEGFNGLRSIVQGRSRELIAAVTQHLDDYRFMPPFHGNDFELKAIVEYQAMLAHGEAYKPATHEELDRLLAATAKPAEARRVAGRGEEGAP
jgi:hypothetical protein